MRNGGIQRQSGQVRIVLIALQVAAVSLAIPAHAGQPRELPPDTGTGLTLRVGGPGKVEREERVETLVVVGGDAVVRGTITDALVVVRGHAAVDGPVLGDLVVVGGVLTLGSDARVERDVILIKSRLNRVPGAIVQGDIRGAEHLWPGWPARLLTWAAMSLAIVAAALLVLALGRETVAGASRTFMTDLGGTVLGTLALWLGAPIVALVALLTVVGVPIAFGIVFFALPTLWFLGYVVVGATLGNWIAQSLWPTRRSAPWAAMVVGMALLQAAALVPIAGPLLALLAGHLGAGALARRAFRQRALTAPAATDTQRDSDDERPALPQPKPAGA